MDRFLLIVLLGFGLGACCGNSDKSFEDKIICGDGLCESDELTSCPQDCIDPECVTDAECGAERICRAAHCVSGCRTEEQCPAGEHCDDGICRQPSTSCTTDDECGPAQRCDRVLGTCVREQVECSADVFEPNDTPESATPLSEGSLSGARICSGDEDLYLFSVQAGDLVDAALVYITDVGALTLELRDTSGRRVAVGVPGPSGVDLRLAVIDDQELLLSVRGSSASVENTYTLNLDLHRECTDANEPNDMRELATPLVDGESIGGRVCGDDVDTFVLRVDSASVELRAAVHVDGGGTLTATLFEPDGATVLDGANSLDSNLELVAGADAPGDYPLVLTTGDDEVVNYELTASVDDLGCDDALEDNDSPSESPLLHRGIFPDLALCRSADRDDYYAVYLEAGDLLDVAITVEQGPGVVTLRLVDAAGDVVAEGRATESGAALAVRAVVTGYVFVAVQLGDSTPQARYTLSLAVPDRTAAACADDGAEDNDDLTSATVLAPGSVVDARLCPGDQDIYAVAVETDEILTASLSAPAAGLHLALVDNAGVQILEALPSGSDAQILRFQTAAAADLNLRVTGPWLDSSYQLEVSVGASLESSVPCVDRFEPNDLPSEAVALVDSEELDLGLCATDLSDYFTVEGVADQTLDVDLSFAHLGGDLDVELVDLTSGEVLATGRSRDDGEHVSWTAPDDAELLLHVYAADESLVENTYDLRVTRQ